MRTQSFGKNHKFIVEVFSTPAKTKNTQPRLSKLLTIFHFAFRYCRGRMEKLDRRLGDKSPRRILSLSRRRRRGVVLFFKLCKGNSVVVVGSVVVLRGCKKCGGFFGRPLLKLSLTIKVGMVSWKSQKSSRFHVI